MMATNWDRRFLSLCKLIAYWSKDPSTKAGAVIVRPDKTIVSLGFNGFPPGVADTEERLQNRDLKLELTIHCEMNALLLTRESVKGCTLYTWPFISCARCAVHVIRAGIARVVAPVASAEIKERWSDSIELSHRVFAEAGIQVTELDD